MASSEAERIVEMTILVLLLVFWPAYSVGVLADRVTTEFPYISTGGEYLLAFVAESLWVLYVGVRFNNFLLSLKEEYANEKNLEKGKK